MLQVVTTDRAPKAAGPYSQAVKYNKMVFVSGQIPINPANGQLITGSITDQTRQVLSNVSAILQEAGSNLDKVVKATVYLTNMQDFDEMNKAYSEFFINNKPARVTVQVAALPKGASIEIDAIAAE